MRKCLIFIVLGLFFASNAFAKTYNLEIKRQRLNITGEKAKVIAVNNQIPGPELHFQEGEDVTINVRNSMNESTSLHWHGILLDGSMDGVPGLNGFDGIAPNQTFTYNFKLRQAGTYWYHSHSNLQEQQGVYGALIIHPKREVRKFDREYVILLSDFTQEDPKTILNNLKIDSGYYNYNKRTAVTFFKDIGKYGFITTLKSYLSWNKMRMDPSDLADVTNYHFLINGQISSKKPTFLFKKGEKVKLRFINASAMTIFDVSVPGLEMQFVEADGQPIKPVKADEFRIGVAETYDVIVTPRHNKAYSIFAESIDRSGFAHASLTPSKELIAKIPKMRPRTLLTMGDMDHSTKGLHHMHHKMKSGWADMSTLKGKRALKYSDLVSLKRQKDLRQPIREIEFRFGGAMNRYIWTINGEKFPEPFKIKYGDRIRLKFVNETMMAHPIHLHGMFMQLENGQKISKMPNKHTVIVPPAQTVTALLTASEAGQWAFHCHLLFHMASGMMTSIEVDKSSKYRRSYK